MCVFLLWNVGSTWYILQKQKQTINIMANKINICGALWFFISTWIIHIFLVLVPFLILEQSNENTKMKKKIQKLRRKAMWKEEPWKLIRSMPTQDLNLKFIVWAKWVKWRWERWLYFFPVYKYLHCWALCLARRSRDWYRWAD